MQISQKTIYALVGLLVLPGCVTFPQKKASQEVLDVKVRYQPGDVYTYKVTQGGGSKVRHETVLATNGRQVEWRNHFKRPYTAYVNPFLPKVEWKTSKRESRLTGLNVGESFLFPPQSGVSDSLTYRSEVRVFESGQVRKYGQRWACSVEGHEKVEVQAGFFDTLKVSCYRNHASKGSYYGQRHIYYAPKLGHWVLKVDNYRKKSSKRTELMSIQTTGRTVRPDLISEMTDVFQRVMEKMPSKKKQTFDFGSLEYSVTPIRTFKTNKGRYCREYVELLEIGSQVYPGRFTACRLSKYNWRRLPV